MKKLIYFTLPLVLMNLISINAMEEKTHSDKPVILIDPGVFAPNAPTVTIVAQALTSAPVILWQHPKILFSAKSIATQAIEIAKTTKGIANVLHKLNTMLQDQGYGTLSQQELKSILQLAVLSAPVLALVEMLHEMHKEHYPIIIITNRDQEEYTEYKKHLKEKHKLDLESILAGSVCAPTNHTYDHDTHPQYKELSETQIISSDRMPNENFLNVVNILANKVSTNKQRFVILQRPDNAEAFSNLGMIVIPFDKKNPQELVTWWNKQKQTDYIYRTSEFNLD